MMQIIGCKNCNKSHLGLESITVNLNFNKNIYCKECHKGHEQIFNNYFCSYDCFIKYTKGVIEEKNQFNLP